MTMPYHTTYRSGTFKIGDRTVITGTSEVDQDLARAWEELDIDYPRFFRTDPLSRLTLLGSAAFFMPGGPLDGMDRSTIGLVTMGRHGSLITDERYFTQLEREGIASPALFVYTLPNIALGELTIQYGLHGPGLCLMADTPDTEQLFLAAATLVREQGMRHVVCGWVDIFAGSASATFLLLGGDPASWPSGAQAQALFT